MTYDSLIIRDTLRVEYLLVSVGILLSKLDEIIPVAKLTKAELRNFFVLFRFLLFLQSKKRRDQAVSSFFELWQ